MNTIQNHQTHNNSAIVCLSRNFLNDINGGECIGLCIEVSITNTSESFCYFNEPKFNVLDCKLCFNFVNNMWRVRFPAKIEPNGKLTVCYELSKSNIDMFLECLSENAEAVVKAFVSTPKGFEFESNPYKLSEIVKDFKRVKDDPFDHIGN